MKPTRPTSKSFKNLVTIETKNKNLAPNLNFGQTLIPSGSDNVFVELPRLSNTYTYNIINSSQMTGDIELKTSGEASLRGLVLNTMGGQVSIAPIEEGTTSLTMKSDVSDGCYVQTLSNGNFWYLWSIASGGDVSYVKGGSTHPVASVAIQYTPPTISLDSTSGFAGLNAIHTITKFSGVAQAGASLTLVEDAEDTPLNSSGDLTIAIKADSTGYWEYVPSPPIQIPNGDYNFKITDVTSQNQATDAIRFYRDGGPIQFNVPSANIMVEEGQAFDFIADTPATAFDPSGNALTVTATPAAYSLAEVHGDTFQVTYSIEYPLGNVITRDVTAEVQDTTPPSKPIINNASFTGFTLTADGTAEDGSTITVFINGTEQETNIAPTPIIATGGTWSFTFTTTLSIQQGLLTVVATDQHGNVSNASDPETISTPQAPGAPSLQVYGEVSNQWTNYNGDFTLTGSTDVGSTVTIFTNGNTQLTSNTQPELIAGPSYNGQGGWEATIRAANESAASLSATSTLNNLTSNGASSTFYLNVDRVEPVITASDASQTVYLGNIGSGNDTGFTVNDDVSGLGINSGEDVATRTSNWDSVVAASEDTYTVEYNVSDIAGNAALPVTKQVIVSTQVVVPTNLVVVGGTEEATITGDVSGVYSENLHVKIYVTDGNGIEVVYEENGSEVLFDVINGSFTAVLTLDAGDYTFSATTVNSIGNESNESTQTSLTTILASLNQGTFPTLTVSREISITGAEDEATLQLNGNATVTDGRLVLDGNGDFATLDSSFSDWNLRDASNIAEDTTFEVWFNPTRLPSANDSNMAGGLRYGLLAKNANNAFGGWLIALDNDSSTTPYLTNGAIQLTLIDSQVMHVRIPVPGGLSTDSSGPGVTLNTWHHVAVVLPASGPGRIYYDGQEISDPVNGFQINQRPSSAAHDLRFGSYKVANSNQNFFAGKIDGAVVTKGVLTSSEILQNYQTGKTIEISDGDTVTINVGDGFVYFATADDAEDGALTPTVDDGGLDTGTVGTYTVQHSVTDSNNNTTTHTFDVEVQNSLLTSQSLLITETPTNIYSGASLQNGIASVSGGNSRGLSLPGSSNYDPSGDITYSAWFNLNQAPTSQHGVFGNISAGTSWSGFSIQLLYSTYASLSDDGFRFVLNGSTKHVHDVAISGGISTGSWHHVAMTKSATDDVRCYFNGVEVKQFTLTDAIGHSDSWTINIGTAHLSVQNGWSAMNGQVQGLRIEQVVKSASNILAVYNDGPQ